jgi:hypothetical protein
MPYKSPAEKRAYQREYYLRRRNNQGEMINHKLFNELLNARYNNIVEENNRLKRIILLHNIQENEIEKPIEEPPAKENKLKDYQELLNELIEKHGEDLVNEKLIEFENANYSYNKCYSALQKTDFMHEFIATFE